MRRRNAYYQSNTTLRPCEGAWYVSKTYRVDVGDVVGEVVLLVVKVLVRLVVGVVDGLVVGLVVAVLVLLVVLQPSA